MELWWRPEGDGSGVGKPGWAQMEADQQCRPGMMRTHSHCNVPELLPMKTSGRTRQLPYFQRQMETRVTHQFVHSYVVHGSVQQFIHRNQFHPLSVLSCAFVSLEAWTLLSTPRWVTSGTKIRQTVINRPSECSREFSTSTSLKGKPPFLLLLLNKESWFFFFSPLFWRFSFEVCWRLEVKFVFLVSEVVCRWRLNKALLCRRWFSHFFLKRCKKPKPNRPKDVWNQV